MQLQVVQRDLLNPELDVVIPVIPRSAIARKVSTRAVRSRDEIQYVLNLLVFEPEAPLPVAAEAALAKIVGSDDGEVPQFTDDEVLGLHDWVMERSLHTLCDRRCGLDVRIEVWQWIHAEEVAEAEMLPFSFQACCAATGVNPEEMRVRLAHMTRGEDFRAKADDVDFNRTQAAKLFRKRHH